MTLEEKTINILVGANIRRIRNKRHISRQNLTNSLHIHPYKLRVIESGAITPSPYLLLAIAKVLDVGVEELFKE